MGKVTVANPSLPKKQKRHCQRLGQLPSSTSSSQLSRLILQPPHIVSHAAAEDLLTYSSSFSVASEGTDTATKMVPAQLC